MKYSGFSICEAATDRPHADTLNHLLYEVELADRGGMDGWFFAEHHSNAQYSLTPSPNLLIAAASSRTERIRLGNMVTVLPYHHPFRVAEEIRMLDALSGGRLEVGLARGGIPHEQVAHGLDSADNEHMLEVGIELLLRFLTEESVDYDNDYWNGTSASAVPEPTQQPHPPMWLGAMSDRTIDMAARFGMSCMTGLAYPKVLQEQMRNYREACESHRGGTAPGRFGLLAYAVVATTEAEAERHGGDAVRQKVNAFLRGYGNPRPGTENSPSARSRRRLFDHISKLSFQDWIDEGLIIFGSVEQCIEQIARIRERGVDMLTFWLHFAGLEFDFADECLRLLCQEVIPRVEGRPAP